jgi:hypothetical protein
MIRETIEISGWTKDALLAQFELDARIVGSTPLMLTEDIHPNIKCSSGGGMQPEDSRVRRPRLPIKRLGERYTYYIPR